ncbi:craniofacial development protein 2-like [Plakobranchus ocellatus]|uniref:Craniofacial development protein 2-like n=1 Tax=Plakobranchus ocellatus TaxID=259542 RepID=A0AAV4B228_9GAST|nr:craniofacial development protein 2-like [Plakobranchus ocellatus]
MTAEIVGPRGDEKNGCRQEWLGYLNTLNKKSLFTSYRRNRFNNVFFNATALLYHLDDLKTFLKDYVSHSNNKLESILLDLEDNILMFVAALSFFNEMLTEAYWDLMQSNRPYGQFLGYVSLMEKALKSWLADDFEPLNSSPVFEDFAPSTPLFRDISEMPVTMDFK